MVANISIAKIGCSLYPDYSKYIALIKSLSPHNHSMEVGTVFGSNIPVLSGCVEPVGNITYYLPVKDYCQMEWVFPNKDSVSVQNTLYRQCTLCKEGDYTAFGWYPKWNVPCTKIILRKQTETSEKFKNLLKKPLENQHQNLGILISQELEISDSRSLKERFILN